nr:MULTISPECIES: hypothetical protein [Sorangium]
MRFSPKTSAAVRKSVSTDGLGRALLSGWSRSSWSVISTSRPGGTM